MIHDPKDYKYMSRAGALAAKVLDHVAQCVKPGISTEELDKIRTEEIEKLNKKSENMINKIESLKIVKNIETYICPNCKKIIIVNKQKMQIKIRCVNCKKEYLIKKSSSKIKSNVTPNFSSKQRIKTSKSKNDVNSIEDMSNRKKILKIDKLEPNLLEFHVLNKKDDDTQVNFKICPNCISKHPLTANICSNCSTYLNNI